MHCRLLHNICSQSGHHQMIVDHPNMNAAAAVTGILYSRSVCTFFSVISVGYLFDDVFEKLTSTLSMIDMVKSWKIWLTNYYRIHQFLIYQHGSSVLDDLMR
jgi:hypothetical protein